MWIICAGGKRSGSTLQYNIISRLVEITKTGLRIPYFKPEDFLEIKEKNKGYAGYKVIKVHALSTDIEKLILTDQAKVVHSFRDLRDVVVSAINKGWIKENVAEIQKFSINYLNEYKLWNSVEKDIISRKYEFFYNQLEEEVRHLASFLGLEIEEEIVQEIVEELDLDYLKLNQDKVAKDDLQSHLNQQFSKRTLLHTNHINDGSTNQFLHKLEPKSIVLIESLAYDYLFDNGYMLTWPSTYHFLSFSQHGDDYIAWQLLGKKSKGIVIEIGAFDGRHLSNSYSFDLMGWETICVEPNPKIYSILKEQRPNALTIEGAIVSDDAIKSIEFYAEEIGVLSGCVLDEDDLKRRYANRSMEYSSPTKIEVPAYTLNKVLQRHNLNNQTIDIISIDVEGFEIEVLKGFDMNKTQVNLFIIEGNTIEERQEILNYFSSYKDYVHLGNNKQNLFIGNKRVINKSLLRSVKFDNYYKAKQKHPLTDDLTLASTTPDFIKSKYYKKNEKYFGLF